jgi:glycosyltransferase involved in cell wall biosynthesis
MRNPGVVIVSPALADANNGNWQTAWRWSRLLAGHYRVRIAAEWQGGHDDKLMIALHARRSAASVAAWRAAVGHRPLVLVLTGTDLYRDIAEDTSAQASLHAADRLVVLNELGVRSLPEALRARAVVCLQSSTTRRTLAKTGRHLRALMVGHLREEKSPQTFFDAARQLAARSDIVLDHVGDSLDAALAGQARALMRSQPNYRWLGGLPHAAHEHARAHPGGARARACQPHGRGRPCHHRSHHQRHAGAGLAHRWQSRPARRVVHGVFRLGRRGGSCRAAAALPRRSGYAAALAGRMQRPRAAVRAGA